MGGFGGRSVTPQTAAYWRTHAQPGAGLGGLKPEDILAEPPPTPDLTDDLVQRARLAAIRRAQMGGALQNSFLTGPYGDTSAPATAAPGLKGT